ncbi:MAG: DUF3298 domain-containing protein [Lachnospiraceae bacterium]|nr:DUF3298 domain-containing protein [Lachnospiraceae bacterium]
MKHDLNHINNDYQNIKVPETLRTKIEDTITQAKEDLAAETLQNRRYQKFFSLRIAAAGAAAAALLLVILVNSSSSIAYAMEQVPFLGTIVKVITFREYEHHENKMEADIKVPEVQIKDKEGTVLQESTEKLNDAIQSYTNEIIAAYEADVKAAGTEGTESVNLDYEIVTDNDKLFSLGFHQTIVMAGGTQLTKIYHIDKSTGDMITLKDLFQEGVDYKTPISENIKQQMKEQMNADENKTYWVDSDVPEWNFTEISDNVNFYINEKGKLVLVFDEYEVAPGYMGIVTFEVPTEIVADIIKEGYLQ